MKRLSFLSFILLYTFIGFAQEHFVVAFPDNGQDHMNIFVLSATINGVAMQAGDEIATFDGTICCGKANLTQPIVITDKTSFAVLASSRSDDDESNGYTIGNQIIFKLWDSTKNMELSGITAEFINPADGQVITPPTYTPGATAFVKLSVIVAAGNKIPESKAGEDQSINEGEKVNLNGSGSSDPEGNSINFLWTAPTGITLSSATAANPTFTAPEVKTDTNFSFFLIVNDGTLNSTSDEVVIQVKQVNKAPVANAGIDQILHENSTCILDGSGSSDPDENTITYLWTPPAGIKLSSATVASPTFIIPEINQDTVLTFSLIVSDGTAFSEQSTVKVNILNVINTALEIFGTNEIKVYPNPSNGIFRIEGLETNRKNNIEIYSMDGKLILQKKNNSIPELIDISEQISGKYLLLINMKPFAIQKQ